MSTLPPVAVLCAADIVRADLEQIIRASVELSVWSPDSARPPKVVLCAAGSGTALRSMLRSPLLDPWPSAVLYDLCGGLGPLSAGLHRFRGYAPPDVTSGRLLRGLSRVAGGEIDAPRSHLATLHRVLEEPPLDDEEKKILQLLAWGRSHDQIITALRLKKRTFEDHLQQLIDLFEATSGQHLGSIAVALDLAVPFEDAPPDWANAALDRRRRRRYR
jgi:hypothetical protein